ncbi:sensor histidine kinase [Asticcacaulis sp. AC466]|uniref:sensor histidine kinase n=1 Tax=Asticcacaulis sp. AC466 TaxID=1282362 RepID=UPI0003F6FC06|nr:ATP-binding protein [Asticcacaulis sp. AC466]
MGPLKQELSLQRFSISNLTGVPASRRPRAWRLWLVLAITLLSAALSFGLAFQGKTLDGLIRGTDTLSLAVPGHPPLPVISLRAAGQATPFVVLPSDLVTQIDGLETYAQVDAHLKRQDEIVNILKGPSVLVGLQTAGRPAFETAVAVRTLCLSDLDSSFWVSLCVGLTAFLVGGWVWCLKPDEKVTQGLAVNGFGMLIAAVSSSATFAKPLALPSGLISALTTLNHLATVLFGLTLLGIFLLFPKPLISDRQYAVFLAAGVPLLVLDQLRLLGIPTGLFIFCFLVVIAAVGLVAIQFHNTRGAPHLRASLIWMGLAVIASGGIWCVTIAAYAIQGQFDTMPESFIFLSFLILYVGIAVGVARFRLFDVGEWALRVFFFTAAALLFICLDAGLIYLAGMAHTSAMALALLITAFGYLPFRDMLWRRFVRSKTLSDTELMGHVLEMAFEPEMSKRQGQWRDLLQKLFVPLSISPSPVPVSATCIDPDNLHLFVPAHLDTPSLQISYPQSGRGLFAPRHIALVDHLLRLSHKAALGLTAYERGAAEQRQRLAQDLHDDVGAKLVSGLIVADEASRPFIYGALNDIREIAAALVNERAPLDRTLAEMRHETVRRLDAANIALDWPLWPEDEAFVELTALQKKALASTVREAITNIIKHSGATGVTAAFRLDGQVLAACVTDDGAGFPKAALDGQGGGQGLKSMVDRIGQMGGKVRFETLTVGASVAFDIPLTSVPATKREAHA